MPFQSPHPKLDIPQCNILSYLFPRVHTPSTDPLWHHASNPDHSLSPSETLLWIKRLAIGFDKLRIPQNATIMVFTPNNLFVPVVYLAAAGSGRHFTGANPAYTADEVAFQIKTVAASIVLVSSDLLDTCLKAATKAGLEKSRLYLFDDLEHQQPMSGVRDWRTILTDETTARNWQWDEMKGEVSTKQIACINFSSGTTGLPKGVCITHSNLIANVEQTIANYFYDTGNSPLSFPPERWLAFLPLYHAYSQLWTISIACKLGIKVYVMRSFVFEDFCANIQRYKITGLQVVPPVIVMLCKRPETKKYDISSIQHAVCGAAPLSRELQNDAQQRLGFIITQGWGMSEVTCGGLFCPGRTVDDTGSVGLLVANTEARLVADEDEAGNAEEITEDGKAGELYIRGPQVLLEYWKNPAATKESKTPDGWLKTGDVAVTKNGRWWIVDRKKELIKVNALQVAPAELEAVLLENQDIADAACTGITLGGEEKPIAYVVLQEGAETDAESIQKFVAGKVAKHKQLTGGVKFVKEIPKLPSGKIVRKLLREWAKRDAKEVEGDAKARL